MRYLSVDLGDKRTGLAIGDDTTGLVSPVGVVEQPRGERLAAAIAKAVAEHQPDALVVGLPINMDGTEGSRAKITRAFGDTLTTITGLPLHYQDERLTTFAADQHMNQSGRTRRQKKAIRDALAAAEILRDFLQS